MDEQIQELADAIYADKVRRARAMTVAERMETGIELFESGLGVMRDGIRFQFPDADESEVEMILKQRLARLKQVHDHGLYTKTSRLDD